ncbi:MAG: DMT family transporter [Pseudomonadota bacterium]
MSDHVKGLLITALGVLFVSPDSLLIRLADLDLWTLAFWRGVFQAAGMTLVLLCFYGRRTAQVFLAIGATGILIALIFAVSTFTFVAAIQHTKVSNALVLLATAPFFAAILSRILLKEPVALRTWAAMTAAVFGVVLIEWDSLGAGTLFGDAMALATALLFGLKIELLRARKSINMIPAMVLASVLYALIALPLAAPGAAGQTQLLWLLLMGLAVLTPATVLITLGPRYLAAPEVALLILLETVLGPFWVWLALSEAPSPLGLLGGALVVASLAVHAALSLRAERRTVAIATSEASDGR